MTGPELRAWMRVRHLSPGELAARLGLGLTTIYRYRDAGTPTHIDVALRTIDGDIAAQRQREATS